MRRSLATALGVSFFLWAAQAALGAPAPPPAASPSPVASPADAGMPADVDVAIMLLYVNHKPMAASPIVRRSGRPLCPVRLARLLDFQVEYVPDAKIATLIRPSGETAVFKVGVDTAVVKTRKGTQRLMKMPIAPMILTPRLRHATDRMWIPLESVVELAGGHMKVDGRKILIER